MSLLLSKSAERRRRRELGRLMAALRREPDQDHRMILIPQIRNLQAKLGENVNTTSELLKATPIVEAPMAAWRGHLPPPSSPAWAPRSYHLG